MDFDILEEVGGLGGDYEFDFLEDDNEKYKSCLEDVKDPIKPKCLIDVNNNNLVNTLINSKEYEIIYNKWLSIDFGCDSDNESDYKEAINDLLSDDELIILSKMDHCHPDNLLYKLK